MRTDHSEFFAVN